MGDVKYKSENINNLKLHLLKTEKFKTLYFVIKMKAPLERETITKRALLPYVLRQGTESYPSEVTLQKKLDDLYGATLSLDGTKKGNFHVLSVRLEIANDKYIHGEESLVNDSLNLLHEIIFKPKTVDHSFDPQIFAREKQTLKNSIESVIDDKIRYANMRLIDEMCKNERYAIRVHGYLDQLQSLNEVELYNYYGQMLEEDEIDIYVLGDFNEKEVTDLIRHYFKTSKQSTLMPFEKEKIKKEKGINTIIERQDINQAKLHIGYRTNCVLGDDDYFALQVFNGLFGGLPSSKLFLNVREKHSLAYYAASRVESLKGLLIVVSGIDAKDYEQARTIIQEQFTSVQNGDFTEENLAETKEQLINNILETLDHANGIVEFMYQQQLAGVELPSQTLIEKIKQVTKKEVVKIANKIELDTIYLLTSEEGEPNEEKNL